MQIDSLLHSISDVAEREIAPSAGTIDRERVFPSANLALLAEVGAYGLVVPKSAGGAGGSLVALAQACRALGGACASTAMVYLMHSVTAAAIAAGGGDRAGDALQHIVAGQGLATLAFSERGTGAHFYAPELKAVRSNGSIRVSGKKSFVTSGSHADLYLLLLQAVQEGAADAVLIEEDRAGVAFEGEWDGLGMAGNSSIAMTMHDVEIAEADRIGGPGGGLDLVFSVVAPYFLVGISAVNTGIANSAAVAATEHAQNRRYSDGTSLAEIQSVQHVIADMDMEWRKAWLLVQDAARLGEEGDEGALVPIMEAKVASTEGAVSVTQKALEITGGQGYSRSLPIERHLRDARAGSVMAPTNAVLRTWIGKTLAGLPLL